MEKIKLYNKYKLTNRKTQEIETDEFVCLRLKKEVDVEILKDKLKELEGIKQWSELERILLFAEVEK